MVTAAAAPAPTPWLRRWRVPGLQAALAVLALALAVSAVDPPPLRETRLRGFDLAQRLWPRSVDNAVVQVVAIDDESLRRWGQWPWPRSLVAELVGRIAAGKPRVLGVDILFPEPDRYSPPLIARSLPSLPALLAETLAQLPSNEKLLADAFAKLPAVLGAGPSNDAPTSQPAPRRVTLVRQLGGDATPYLSSYASMIRSLPEIGRAARAEAALTSEPDDDGTIRSVPLFTLAEGQLIPALAVEAIRVAAGIPSLAISTGRSGIENVVIGPLTVPTDGNGRAYLHFAPPAPRYTAAATVLDPGFDPAQLFDGKIVLLGVTGLGILDQKETPLGMTQGIEVHAQLIDSILAGSLLQPPASPAGLELLVILAAGLAVIGLVRYDSPAAASAAALAIAVALLGGEFALFRFAGWLVDAIYPAAVTLACFGAMLGGHLRAAQAARRQLAAELEQERERTARLEGELAAAHAIQMGLLPHHFPPFPERRDIDLYARIEPARAVGGDLFDFLLIDPTHLFFFIGDVSGKGIPAALFMAMTKEVVRDAVQRHGSALDQVLAEANAKTAAASNEMDMMFVTVFAGILDLASGELTYASAGHDRPFLLQDSGGLRQLETAGGPPLGVIDDFLFPIDRDQLETGTVLLLYTDGVTEAQDAAGGLYSSARLSTALATMPADDAQSVVDACFAAVQRFVGDAEQADDITVLAIRRAG